MNHANNVTLNKTPVVSIKKSLIKKINRFVVYFTLIAFSLFYLMPMFVMVTTSIKSMDEIRTGSLLSLPQGIETSPWVDAWSQACVGIDCVGLSGFYLPTFLMVIPAVIISTLIGALNGFALTKYKFKGAHLLFGLIMFGCFTPYQAVIIPMAKMLGELGFSGGTGGLILTHVIYGIPFTTMFFRNYFVSVPQDLVNAARIDGAGFFTIFLKVMLPIAIPIIVVSLIWQFTNIWNDYLFGVSLSIGSSNPIMVALNNLVSTSQGEKPYNTYMAAAILAALPTLLIYVVAGKYFIRGLMAGSVKG